MNITNREDLIAEFQIRNFKSYSGDTILFKIVKPITIIAGPNGEGKTNLLEAMLVGIANFINHSIKLKKNSLFTKSIKISSKPEINESLKNIIFTDFTKKSLIKRSHEILYPERLDPKNIISYKRRRGAVLIRILKQTDRGLRKLAEMTTNIFSLPRSFKHAGYVNKLEHLELLYLNPDTILNDFFVKLVGQEFSNQLRHIQGTARKAEYQGKILQIFPKDEDRLICDIENGEFEEIYLKDMNLFLTSNLATGAKKECILYILGILVEKFKFMKDWITIFLIDEIEEGLHISRQKKIMEALINAFREDEELRKHIKIVMTTHSPIIYSELMKYPEYVDLYFVLRNPKEPSKIFEYNAVVGDELKEKRILAELGLNIYELPRKLLFVEGPTDQEFWNEVLEDVGILPLWGASIPKIVSELIGSYPIARSKEYFVVVDRSGYDKTIKDIQNLKNEGVNINGSNIVFNSLEELIFDVNIDIEESSIVWDKIDKIIQEFYKKLEEAERDVIEININEARENLEERGKDGIKEFFDSLKNKENFYKIIGKNWFRLLKESSKEIIKKLKNNMEE